MTEVVQEEAPENPPVIPNETVTAPAKVMRIGSMIKQLLDEVHSMTMDVSTQPLEKFMSFLIMHFGFLQRLRQTVMELMMFTRYHLFFLEILLS